MSCETNQHKFFHHLGGEFAQAGLMEGDPAQCQRFVQALYDAGYNEPPAPAPSAHEHATNQAATMRVFAEMQRLGLKPPVHSPTGMPKPEAQNGYRHVYETAQAMRLGRPLSPLATATRHLIEQKPQTRPVTGVLPLKGRLGRCSACGRYRSTERPHWCPVTATSASLSRALARRVGLPRAAFPEDRLEGVLASARRGGVELTHGLTGERIVAELDGLLSALRSGYMPDAWREGGGLAPDGHGGLVAVPGPTSAVQVLHPDEHLAQATAALAPYVHAAAAHGAHVDVEALLSAALVGTAHQAPVHGRHDQVAESPETVLGGTAYDAAAVLRAEMGARLARPEWLDVSDDPRVGPLLTEAVRELATTTTVSVDDLVMLWDRQGRTASAYDRTTAVAGDREGSKNLTPAALAAVLTGHQAEVHPDVDWIRALRAGELSAGEATSRAADLLYGQILAGDGTLTAGGRLATRVLVCGQCGHTYSAGADGLRCPDCDGAGGFVPARAVAPRPAEPSDAEAVTAPDPEPVSVPVTHPAATLDGEPTYQLASGERYRQAEPGFFVRQRRGGQAVFAAVQSRRIRPVTIPGYEDQDLFAYLVERDLGPLGTLSSYTVANGRTGAILTSDEPIFDRAVARTQQRLTELGGPGVYRAGVEQVLQRGLHSPRWEPIAEPASSSASPALADDEQRAAVADRARRRLFDVFLAERHPDEEDVATLRTIAEEDDASAQREPWRHRLGAADDFARLRAAEPGSAEERAAAHEMLVGVYIGHGDVLDTPYAKQLSAHDQLNLVVSEFAHPARLRYVPKDQVERYFQNVREEYQARRAQLGVAATLVEWQLAVREGRATTAHERDYDEAQTAYSRTKRPRASDETKAAYWSSATLAPQWLRLGSRQTESALRRRLQDYPGTALLGDVRRPQHELASLLRATMDSRDPLSVHLGTRIGHALRHAARTASADESASAALEDSDRGALLATRLLDLGYARCPRCGAFVSPRSQACTNPHCGSSGTPALARAVGALQRLAADVPAPALGVLPSFILDEEEDESLTPPLPMVSTDESGVEATPQPTPDPPLSKPRAPRTRRHALAAEPAPAESPRSALTGVGAQPDAATEAAQPAPADAPHVPEAPTGLSASAVELLFAHQSALMERLTEALSSRRVERAPDVPAPTPTTVETPRRPLPDWPEPDPDQESIWHVDLTQNVPPLPAPDFYLDAVPRENGGQLKGPLTGERVDLKKHYIENPSLRAAMTTMAGMIGAATRVYDRSGKVRSMGKAMAFSLIGEPGCGKNETVEQLAAALRWRDANGKIHQGVPYHRITVPVRSTAQQLVGGEALRAAPQGGTDSRVLLGDIGKALMVGGVVQIDEAANSPEVLLALNNAIEKRSFELPSASGEATTFQVHPSTVIVVTYNAGTGRGSTDAERYGMMNSTLSRFAAQFEIAPPDETALAQRLRGEMAWRVEEGQGALGNEWVPDDQQALLLARTHQRIMTAAREGKLGEQRQDVDLGARLMTSAWEAYRATADIAPDRADLAASVEIVYQRLCDPYPDSNEAARVGRATLKEIAGSILGRKTGRQ